MRLPATLAVLVATGLALAAAAPPAGAAIAFAPCAQAAPLQCGTLDVPLDRTGAVPGTVRLSAVRRLAAASPTPTALVGLAGGPGQAALPLASDIEQLMAPALATRDLLVFDQRGTGSSGALRCSLTGTLTQAGRRCARDLGTRRGQYTTSTSVDDIEALRVAGGYDKLVLFGVSYGTKVALEYAARYPSHVEALVLDSVVLPSGPDPLQRSTFAAMARVLGDLCAGTACAGISTDPTRDLANRVRSLARKPLRGLLTSASGVHERVTIDRGDLFGIMLTGDENPTLRAELPGALTSARRGDSAPLIRLAARSAGIINLSRQSGAGEADFDDAVFAATLCEEGDFPWNRAAGSAARSQQVNAFAHMLPGAPFSPFDIATALTNQIIELCVGWPMASTPVATGPEPDVPTLVIDGAADIRTPLADAAQVKSLIPDAQMVAIPFTGHSALASDLSSDQCAERAVGQFFAAQAVAPCAAGGQNPFSPTPVAPTRLTQLKPTGPAGKVGLTISAALATATDIRRQIIGDALEAGSVPTRTGGLRGGRATVHGGRLTLIDVTYVPGVQVSGSERVDGTGTGALRIRGAKAAHGSLTITSKTITGVLGGHRVSLVSRAAAVDATGASNRGLTRLLSRFGVHDIG
ncbi:MAG TPA: alpha/beta fold hydrolase [Solirubrobacteraceae bacterium]|jgi:pimeloyl-ACP methyl ester carboxylesterase